MNRVFDFLTGSKEAMKLCVDSVSQETGLDEEAVNLILQEHFSNFSSPDEAINALTIEAIHRENAIIVKTYLKYFDEGRIEKNKWIFVAVADNPNLYPLFGDRLAEFNNISLCHLIQNYRVDDIEKILKIDAVAKSAPENALGLAIEKSFARAVDLILYSAKNDVDVAPFITQNITFISADVLAVIFNSDKVKLQQLQVDSIYNHIISIDDASMFMKLLPGMNSDATTRTLNVLVPANAKRILTALIEKDPFLITTSPSLTNSLIISACSSSSEDTLSILLTNGTYDADSIYTSCIESNSIECVRTLLSKGVKADYARLLILEMTDEMRGIFLQYVRRVELSFNGERKMLMPMRVINRAWGSPGKERTVFVQDNVLIYRDGDEFIQLGDEYGIAEDVLVKVVRLPNLVEDDRAVYLDEETGQTYVRSGYRLYPISYETKTPSPSVKTPRTSSSTRRTRKLIDADIDALINAVETPQSSPRMLPPLIGSRKDIERILSEGRRTPPTARPTIRSPPSTGGRVEYSRPSARTRSNFYKSLNQMKSAEEVIEEIEGSPVIERSPVLSRLPPLPPSTGSLSLSPETPRSEYSKRSGTIRPPLTPASLRRMTFSPRTARSHSRERESSEHKTARSTEYGSALGYETP